MKVAVFGLGYVGSVTATCLAKDGHEVVGVEPIATKVDAILAGQPPVAEPGLAEIVTDVVASGRLSATTSADLALTGADLALICVGTPSRHNGSLDLRYVHRVAEQIGEYLKADTGRDKPLTVVFRSTMLPGSVEGELAPIIEKFSGTAVGTSFDVAFCPEFLREATAISDFYRPPFTVIGTESVRAENAMRELLAAVDAPVHPVPIATAEALKYACNAFHAVKVAFGNEIGRFCDAVGVDGRDVMDIFTQDTDLNISARYLRPGFAFGGSCLPKDVRAIVHRARSLDVELPMIGSLLATNEVHIRRAVEHVLDSDCRRVTLVGLSFKAGTDDLRESPYVELAEVLLGKGVELSIYDTHIQPDRLVGANRAVVEDHLPHLHRILTNSVPEALVDTELVLLATNEPDVVATVRASGLPIVDLQGPATGWAQPELAAAV